MIVFSNWKPFIAFYILIYIHIYLSICLGTYLLLVLGSVITVIGFLGFCGAWRESAWMLGTVRAKAHIFVWFDHKGDPPPPSFF